MAHTQQSPDRKPNRVFAVRRLIVAAAVLFPLFAAGVPAASAHPVRQAASAAAQSTCTYRAHMVPVVQAVQDYVNHIYSVPNEDQRHRRALQLIRLIYWEGDGFPSGSSRLTNLLGDAQSKASDAWTIRRGYSSGDAGAKLRVAQVDMKAAWSTLSGICGKPG